MRDLRRRVARAALVMGLGMVLVALVTTALTAHAVVAPAAGAVPDHADAIVVFAGERARLDRALQLVSQGRADTLVVSDGERISDIAPRCGDVAPVRVLCPTPDEQDTRHEAEMFARIGHEQGWHALIAVTGDYHVARARLLLDRCWAGSVAFAPVPWPHVGLSHLVHEAGGLVDARVLDRSC